MHSNEIKSKLIRRTSCDKCGSSDANALYEDGSQWCFSCETYTSPNKERTNVVTIQHQQPQTTRQPLSQGQLQALPDRKISQETCRAYGVTVMNGKHVYPYYDDSNNHQTCLLYTSPSPRDRTRSRMPSSA